jgi:voltage-gated potassium channel
VTNFEDLPAAQRRRLLAWTVLRSSFYASLLVAAFYLLPLDLSGSDSVAVLTAGLLIVAVFVAWEVRSIVRADYPVLQAIAALILTVPLFLLLFSTVYYLMEHAAPRDFTEHMTRTDALYFTVTTFATVGFGDITARSQGARLVVTVQMLADLLVIGFGIKVLFGAAKMGRRRRRGAGTDRTRSSSRSRPEAEAQETGS